MLFGDDAAKAVLLVTWRQGACTWQADNGGILFLAVCVCTLRQNAAHWPLDLGCCHLSDVAVWCNKIPSNPRRSDIAFHLAADEFVMISEMYKLYIHWPDHEVAGLSRQTSTSVWKSQLELDCSPHHKYPVMTNRVYVVKSTPDLVAVHKPAGNAKSSYGCCCCCCCC
jgi:hypothetical protein